MLIDSLDHPDWKSLAERVLNLRRIAILTGAGISAESGLPTFRSNGLWENHRVEDVATPEAFERDPKFVWRFYNMRREGVFKAQPNAGHRALVELEAKSKSFALITQNVDGLHQMAGTRNVIELHGNIRRVRCTDCSKKFETSETLSDEPMCDCGSKLRPDIVWFGEMLPQKAILNAREATSDCDLFLVIGTSAVVHPAAGLIYEARSAGAFVIEVNPAETEASSLAHAILRGTAAVMLPKFVEIVS